MRLERYFLLAAMRRSQKPYRPAVEGGAQFFEFTLIGRQNLRGVFKITEAAHRPCTKRDEARAIVFRLCDVKRKCAKQLFRPAAKTIPAAETFVRHARIDEGGRNP